jgi:hypothetical protein
MKILLILTFTLSSYFLFSQTWVSSGTSGGIHKLIKNGSSVIIKWENANGGVTKRTFTCNNFKNIYPSTYDNMGKQIRLNSSDGDYFIIMNFYKIYVGWGLRVGFYNELGSSYWVENLWKE